MKKKTEREKDPGDYGKDDDIFALRQKSWKKDPKREGKEKKPVKIL